ncbi:hypothetical protein [Serratia fonticola]|uniref:hypothetical protein n=1 Tax=Serratia fonticola TaxID=47917 RepID=UPI00301D176A
MAKSNQQSRSGWGGKRTGAGAPLGNMNAVKHGERSRRAFFPLPGSEQLPPLIGLRVRNLLLAEHIGGMKREGRYFSGRLGDWREQMLLDGIMWQHTRHIVRLELSEARLRLIRAKSYLTQSRAGVA